MLYRQRAVVSGAPEPACPPIIIIGMHRSGTSMVAGLLAQLGLFIGAHTDANNESRLILALERGLLRWAGSSWQEPQALAALLAQPAARAVAAARLRRALASPRSLSYLGYARYWRYRTPAALDAPWGWKSPVSTYTLPLWRTLFPDARVVHIVRHGVDVAQSLRLRADREQAVVRQRLHVSRALLYRYWRIISLERGFALWEAYLQQAHEQVDLLGPRAIELRYEEVLADPVGALQELASFCGLPAGVVDIQRVAGNVRPERAYAYRTHPELRRFAARVAPRLQVHGYDSAVRGDSGGRQVLSASGELGATGAR